MNRRSFGSACAVGARGVTLTELLVVLAIISLLATILLPVYVNKMQQARIATAKQEVREIAEAEEACASIHGFYVPFQVLDDLNPGALVATGARTPPDILSNSVQTAGGIFLIDPNTDLLAQLANQRVMTASDLQRQAVPRVETMYQNWSGPFLKFQRYFRPNINTNTDPSNTNVRDDYPLDPWGQPYRFFWPLGLIGTGAENLSAWSDGNFNGSLRNTGQTFYDRFAVVSLGPDGLSEGIGGGGRQQRQDDIAYIFGGLFNESSFRAFY
jgi:prepilin-type N-terminal cleavage/methylation domain-containing protein